MYAVIETGGKQYKVAIGDRVKVEKIIADEGASVKLEKVLMVADGDKVTVGSPLVDSPVMATVMAHGKKNKIEVFKMKRRKNYRRMQGHRQQYTELEITAIGSAKAKPASKQAATKTEPASEAKKVSNVESSAQQVTEKKVAGKLTDVSGLGGVMETKLHAAGIETLEQLAQLDQDAIAQVAEKIGAKTTGKLEQFVESAKQLVG